MRTAWWALFLVSGTVLIMLLLRSRYSRQWLGFVALNIVTAAIVLYGVNWLGSPVGLHIPLNPATVGTIGVLGVPGVLLLTAMKWTLV